MAPKKPSLVQKNLLASKLVEPNFHLPETEELPRLGRLDGLDLRPRPDRPDRSEAYRLSEAVIYKVA